MYYGELRELKSFLVNNTPRRYFYKSKFKLGITSPDGESGVMQTPNEVGLEQKNKIIACYPEEGVIEAYSQIPMKFVCKSRVSDEIEQWASDYAISKNEKLPKNEEYVYTVFFNFEGDDEYTHLTLMGKGICPMIRISRGFLNFGECPMNEKRDILVNVENNNDEIPIDISFKKQPYFFATPEIIELSPRQASAFIVTFAPKNLGQYHVSFNVLLVNGAYTIPLKIFASSKTITNMPKKVKGPAATISDFKHERVFVKDSVENGEETPGNIDKFALTSKSQSAFKIYEMSHSSSKVDMHLAKQYNARKFNDYLKDSRVKRVESKKKEKYETKMNEMMTGLKSRGLLAGNEKGDKIDNAPIDIEFISGLMNTGLKPTKLPLPEFNDPLFVTKPIDKYEPVVDKNQLAFVPDPDAKLKKKFPSEPKSHKEFRDCYQELDGDKLQKIFAGPTNLDFGTIFVKSVATKVFTVRNDLRSTIQVRMETDCPELSQTYQKGQIIPSSQTGLFEVAISSNQVQQFKGFVKYIINEVHNFEFMVTAQIDPVSLHVSPSALKFNFHDESIEMTTSDVILISNKGNAPGKFQFVTDDNKCFSVNPKKGVVNSGSSQEILVTYSPLGNSNNRAEEERLLMKVGDGIDQLIKCSGYVQEAKCAFLDQSLDLGIIPIFKRVESTIRIKNLQRYPCVYQITEQPPYLDITPVKGRLGPDDTKPLKVVFYWKEELAIKNHDIAINLRGGKPIKLPFSAYTMIPKVRVVQDEFNFGNVTTLGNSQELKLTITNDSDIPASLLLDLRDRPDIPKELEGAECLDFSEADEIPDDETSVMMSIDSDQEEDDDSDFLNNSTPSMNNLGSEESDEEDVENKVSSRYYRITAKPHRTLNFYMRFSPRDIRSYSFELPLTLAGYGRLDDLTRIVNCNGIKPRFLIEPSVVDFKKKIITTVDKCIPTFLEMNISNPDNVPIHWKTDSAILAIDKVFSFVPNQGVLEAGQTSIIKVGFNPFTAGQFKRNIPFYVDDDTSKPYIDVQLNGYGAYPRITFDRREIILPVVPLGIKAVCSFKVINDGYENLAIKHHISQDLGQINIELDYKEGKNVGITKSRLQVDAIFWSDKPISFTRKIEFSDDSGKVYSIPISGTSENCLLTNFPFLQRNSEDFAIEAEPNKPVMIREVVMSDEEDNKKQGLSIYGSFSKAGSAVSSKSSRSKLGYNPIPKFWMDRSVDAVIKWLNNYVLVTAIQTFPADIIAANGSQFLDLYVSLSGKPTPFKANISEYTKRNERVEMLISQHDEFIKALKVNGAFLNTIRPEFLLSFSDFNTFLKMNPSDTVWPGYVRISERRYNYLSTDSWLTLFFQILKVYYLSRITVKTFKALPGIPADKLVLPDYYLDNSNIYSQAEGILLRWLEINFELVKGKTDRLLNFDSDLKDCQAFSSAILNYLGSTGNKAAQNMRPACYNEEDYKFNTDKLMIALNDIGIKSFLERKEFGLPSPREMVLFTMHLYLSLPHYIPKGQPILFTCVLGEEVVKYIELTNSSGKAISYWVKYEGSSDFIIESDSVKIEPKQNIKFSVKFSSRVFTSVSGRITFTNKKDGGTQAAALVFDLKSKITARKSIESWQTKAKLYQNEEIKLMIKNIYSNSPHEYGDFQIQLIHEEAKQEEDQTQGKKSKNKKKGGKAIKEEKKKDEFIVPPFFCPKDKIRIRKGDVQPLIIHFLPFAMDTHRCKIIFSDANVGEFQHEIVGETLMPDAIGEIKPNFLVYVDTPMQMEQNIPFRNEQLMNAHRFHEGRLTASGKTKEKENYLRMKKEQPSIEYTTLETEVSPPTSNLSIPQTVNLHDPGKAAKKKSVFMRQKPNDSFDSKNVTDLSGLQATGEGGGVNKLPITFNFKTPFREYYSTIIMKNQTKTDIRIYRLGFTVAPKVVKATIEMKVPAGDDIKQEIPIINNTDRDWNNLKIQWVCEPSLNGMFFSGPKDFSVKKKTKGLYTVLFRPPYMLKAEAKLTITNNYTNGVYEYELIGIGEEPLARDHIILNCTARKVHKKEIEVINPYPDRPCSYKVETDLMNAEGPLKFTIPPDKTYKYILSVTPVLGGMYTGSITFTEETDENKYIWYTILVNTERPKTEKSVTLSSNVRKTIAFDVCLSNPLDEEAIFEVIIEGDSIMGNPTFKLPPQKEGVYELFFTPLKSFKSKGSISFINDRLGEVWYDLNLISEENPVQKLPTLKAELGKVEEHIVVLENPSNKETRLFFQISNPGNFDVLPEKISIPAYDSVEVAIRYTPSDLDVEETSEIIFTSEEIGKWNFFAFGKGLPPTKFDPKTIVGSLNTDYSTTINFRNPFKDSITAVITMETDADEGVFQILLKKSKTTIPGLSTLQIPFSFTPKVISEFKAEIIIHMNDKIEWRCPIIAITECVSNNISYSFKSKCRQQLESDLNISLPGLPADVENCKIKVELANIPPEYNSMLTKVFSLTQMKSSLESIDDQLVYKIRFLPMKPFKTSIDIIVTRFGGGRWKFKMHLEATEPDVDDIISICSPLHKTSSVSFKLTNRFKSYAPYTAYFTPDSDTEFAIMPKTGELEPYGRDGTSFVVSFSPTEYGKQKQGKLVIQTNESYLVKGTFPNYKRPEIKDSMIMNRLEPEIQEKMQHREPKNFMKGNIKNAGRKLSPSQREHLEIKNSILKDQTKDFSKIIPK